MHSLKVDRQLSICQRLSKIPQWLIMAVFNYPPEKVKQDFIIALLWILPVVGIQFSVQEG